MKFPDCSNIVCCEIEIIPRYCETDQAGVVHHSVYPVWFEMGRTELLRANGLAYRDMEKAGEFMVVAELHVRYRRPAFYDEKLKLITKLGKVSASKVEHIYELYRPETGLLLAEGYTYLACVDSQGKIRRVPEYLYPGSDQKV